MAEYSADYYDGRTARRREATVHFGDDALVIAHGDTRETWPYAMLRLVKGGRDPDRLRLSCPLSYGARLVIGRDGFETELRQVCPDIDKAGKSWLDSVRLGLWSGGVAVVVLIAALVVNEFPSVAVKLIPPEWEEDAGEKVVGQILQMASHVAGQEAKPCTAEPGRSALAALGARLANGAGAPYPIRLTVADIEMVNALAAPGGRIVVFRGLIDKAEGPDELAGVIAHEIGHVVKRHPTEGAIRQAGLGAILDALLGPLSGGDVASTLGQAMIGAAYSRDAETVADQQALEILNRSDISPAGLGRFFERLSKDEADAEAPGMLRLLASHPPSALRAEMARAVPTGTTRPALTRDQWRAVKAICGTKGKAE